MPDREPPEIPHISGPSPLPGDPGRAAEDLLGELEFEERLAAREEEASKRPLSFWWLALFILVLHTEAVAFSFNLVSPTLVPISTEFETTQLGWMYTSLTLVGAVSIPLTTKLADLYGKKRMILVVTAIATVGALLVAIANSYAVVLVGRALEGTLLALVPLVYSIMRDIFPRRILAFSVTIAASGVGVVTIAGPFIAGYLVDNHGWQSVFWFLFVEQFDRPDPDPAHHPRVAGAPARPPRLARCDPARRWSRRDPARRQPGRHLGMDGRPDARLHLRRPCRAGAVGGERASDRRAADGPDAAPLAAGVDHHGVRAARTGRARRRGDDAADPRADTPRARHRLRVRRDGHATHPVHRPRRRRDRGRRLRARRRDPQDRRQDPRCHRACGSDPGLPRPCADARHEGAGDRRLPAAGHLAGAGVLVDSGARHRCRSTTPAGGQRRHVRARRRRSAARSAPRSASRSLPPT